MQTLVRTLLIAGFFAGLVLVAPAAQAAEHHLGLGIHYWRAIDDFDDLDDISDIEDDGSSYIVSYQYIPRGLFTFEFDAEIFEDGFAGSDDTAISPQAFILVGRGIYGGVGAGITYSSDLEDDFSDAFYMAKLGFRFSVLGSLSVDIGAIYRFDDWDALQDIDLSSDTFTLGAIARLKL